MAQIFLLLARCHRQRIPGRRHCGKLLLLRPRHRKGKKVLPVGALGPWEYRSRKFQQVGEQNCQPEGTACQKLGFQQAAKTAGQKSNTRQPARESEGQLHTGAPRSTAVETSVV